MRRQINAALVACGAVVGVLTGMTPAQAADAPQVFQNTDATQMLQVAGVSQTSKVPFSSSARSNPVQVTSLHCSAGTFNYDGYQWSFNISCSPISPTSVWLAYISCSDQNTYTSSVYTSFQNVSIFCPPDTTPVEGGVAWA